MIQLRQKVFSKEDVELQLLSARVFSRVLEQGPSLDWDSRYVLPSTNTPIAKTPQSDLQQM